MPEKLEPLTIDQAIAKPMTFTPKYTECEKRILAWSIVWEGCITITEDHKRNSITYVPEIKLSNTDFGALERFVKTIGKLGRIKPKPRQPKDPKHSPTKEWSIKTLYEVAFALQNITRHIHSKRKRKIAYLVAEFCSSRIDKNEKARRTHTRIEGYSQREHEIYLEVQKLNKRGL